MKNYINGQLVAPINGRYIDNYNPAVGQIYSTCPNSDSADVQQAYEAAQAAFVQWKNTPAENKFIILNRIAELIDLHVDALAKAESTDQGKPVWLAVNEIKRAAQNFRFYATATMQFATESHITENTAINYTVRQPIGVVGCISPWNLPLYLFTWKIAPALAAGNCVVAKPSEITPLTAFLLSEICIEAGLPAGVLNIVHGDGPSTGQAIIEHKNIKAISFTGGTATGKHIASVASPMFKKISLELGGKNPNIIFADCDFEKMIKTTINSSLLNQGEICLCGSRIYVERSIYDQFKTRLVEEVEKMKTGNPADADTKVGAIVSKPHYEKVLSCITRAKDEGGTILTGGKAKVVSDLETGWYIEPTVIEGLKNNCVTQQEEIFGPVVTITPFDTEEEVVQMANESRYGLAATIWTENLNKAHRVAAAVDSGIIWINCWLLRDLRTPFGGMKDSGVGREGGWEAMRFFTEQKNVCIKL
ncbi:MAG: aldehyde dehydrogenase [Bacteroidetes bacterium]|nr:aldehyde dehydrogenase [Bacteroidota bacterium]